MRLKHHEEPERDFYLFVATLMRGVVLIDLKCHCLPTKFTWAGGSSAALPHVWQHLLDVILGLQCLIHPVESTWDFTKHPMELPCVYWEGALV